MKPLPAEESGGPEPGLEESAGLTSTLIRELRLGEVILSVRRSLGGLALATEGLDAISRRTVADPQRRRQRLVERKQKPIHTLDDAHFEQVADVYRAACEPGPEGGRPKPTEAVADHFFIEHSTAEKWVAQCRPPHRNLLPPARQGRAG